jgi:hypothetical protein
VDPQDLVLWHLYIINHLYQVQGLGPVLPVLTPVNFVQPFLPWSPNFTISNQVVIPHSFCLASQHVISLACSLKPICSRMLCDLHFPLIFSFKSSLWKCVTHSSSQELHLSCFSSYLVWSYSICSHKTMMEWPLPCIDLTLVPCLLFT